MAKGLGINDIGEYRVGNRYEDIGDHIEDLVVEGHGPDLRDGALTALAEASSDSHRYWAKEVVDEIEGRTEDFKERNDDSARWDLDHPG